MAVFDAILIPGAENATLIDNLGATTASSSQVIGTNKIFTIVCEDRCHIRFGDVTNIADPTTSSYPLQADKDYTFDTGTKYDRFRIYNPGAGTTDIWYWELSQF